MKDTKDFNERFLRWKNGENYWLMRGVSLGTNSDRPATKELVELIKSRLAKFLDGKDNQSQKMQIGSDHDWQNNTINGGTLPEVTIIPTNDASWLFSTGKYKYNSRKPLADKYTRRVVSNYLSKFDNENAEDYNARISRLADVLDIRGVQFKKNDVKSGKLKGRAHYIDSSATAYIDNMKDIFAEAAHPWQHAKGNNNIEEEVGVGTYDSDNDPRGGTRYAYPDTAEGETHSFFEPTLTEWIETGKISKSSPMLNKSLSKQKIVPKNRIEVADSAASWNRQAIDKRIISMPSQLPLLDRIKYTFSDFPLLDKSKTVPTYRSGKDNNTPRPITTGGAGYIPPAPNINPINLPNSVEEARMRLYNKVSPVWGFTDDTVKAFFDTMLYGDNVFAQTVGEKDEFGFKNPPVIIDDPYVDGVWAEYLQIPENKRRSKYKLQKSKYRPTIGDENVTYYTIPINERAKEELVNEGVRIPLNKNKTSTTLMGYNHGEHTVGKGFDPQKGEYISYYDRWDLNPFSSRYSSETKLKNNSILKKLGLLDNRKYGDLSFGLGKPLDFYDRIYLDDYFGINQPTHATWLPEVVVTPTYRKGKDSGIHINKNDL